MPPKSGTVVCDRDKCVIGNYRLVEGQGTAHQRLAQAAGMRNPTVAGSIKPDGKIDLRSESINAVDAHGRHHESRRDASGTPLGEWARMKMELGELETTKTYKSASRASTSRPASAGPTKSDGTLDMRYKANRNRP
jgi:hypothetical protein